MMKRLVNDIHDLRPTKRDEKGYVFFYHNQPGDHYKERGKEIITKGEAGS